MKCPELELLIENLFKTLLFKIEAEIKKAILNTKNMSTSEFWYSEEELINELFCSNKLKEFFGFKEYRVEIGQPYPDEILPIYCSVKYQFLYFSYVHLYDDYELVKQLSEDNVLKILSETGRRTKEGYGIMEQLYIDNPTLVVIYSFDKPKFYDVDTVKIQYGFYEFLENVCGIDIVNIKRTIDTYKARIKNLSRSAGYYAKKDDVFKKQLFNKVFQNASNNFTDTELATVCDYITNCEYSESIIRMLLTYNYTCELYKKYPNDFIDLTFVTVSLYKIVEVLFCAFVNKLFGTTTIVDKKGKKIDLSSDELTLGELNQIFYCNNETIRNYLYNSYPYSNKLKQLLKEWIKYSRNGFLHKDSIKDDTILEESALSSLDILCWLILTFSR